MTDTSTMLGLLGLGKGKSFDRQTLLMIMIAKAIAGMLLLADILVNGLVLDKRFLIAGTAMFVIGAAVRVMGHIKLGKQFTIHVKIVPRHKLVVTGIHKYMRHPMYTGLFLMVIGSCIALHSLWAVIATFVLLVPAGIYRVKVEEEVLVKNFGKQYTEYAKRTKRFIPYLF
jgi:protein-S-isoprenylcysteine O-methyltransferase Ste14